MDERDQNVEQEKNGISQKALCKKGNLQNKGSRKRNLSMRSQR